MKLKTTILFSLLSLTAFAAGGGSPALIDMQFPERPAPPELELSSYESWARETLPAEAYSAFTPFVFDWLSREEGRAGLPPEVYQEPSRIHVNVERPLAETIELEDAGEIEVGNTVGAEVYAEMAGTVDQALEAMLFQWGKPVGGREGRTYFVSSPFARRVEYFAPLPALGDGAYANLSLRRDGGIVKDLADRYVLLVRGDSERGYAVVMQFVKAAPRSQTQRVFAVALLQPLADGKVSYRISTRYQGQSYKVLGNVSIGRAQIGFNRDKVRAVAEEYRGRLNELRETGGIKEKKTDIEWGK